MAKREWPVSKDPEVNEQPDPDNPHNGSDTNIEEDFSDLKMPYPENEPWPEDPNIQPERDNPHNEVVEEGSEMDIEEFVQSYLGELTDEFDKAEHEQDFLTDEAARISEELEREYEQEGIYLVLDIGPEGFNPVILANEDQFIIHKEYNPDAINYEGNEWSPLSDVDKTQHGGELRIAMMGYEIGDLTQKVDLDESSLAQYWDVGFDYMEGTNQRFFVGPGFAEPYRERTSEES